MFETWTDGQTELTLTPSFIVNLRLSSPIVEQQLNNM